VVVEQFGRVKRKIPKKSKNFFFYLQNYFRNTIVKYLCVLCYVVGLVAEANFIVSQNQKKQATILTIREEHVQTCSNMFKQDCSRLFSSFGLQQLAVMKKKSFSLVP